VRVEALRETAVGLEEFEEGTNVKERKLSEVPSGNSKTNNTIEDLESPLKQ
jgi:hypothetical protein